MPDISEPVPDAGHEALRQAVVSALADVNAQIDRINRVYSLLLGSAHAMQGTLNIVQSAQQQIGALNIRVEALHVRCDTAIDGMDVLQEQVADLIERVTDVEQRLTPLPGPDAAG